MENDRGVIPRSADSVDSERREKKYEKNLGDRKRKKCVGPLA